MQSPDLNILKIDRSFVDIGTRAPTSQIVSHIIAMPKTLGLQVIAEGVERQSQADSFYAYQAQYAQGWLFGRPVAFDLIMKQVLCSVTVTQQSQEA